MTHPPPSTGDIWRYSYDASRVAGGDRRTYHVLVLGIASDGEFNCLTLETGDVDYWIMDVLNEYQDWEHIA